MTRCIWIYCYSCDARTIPTPRLTADCNFDEAPGRPCIGNDPRNRMRYPRECTYDYREVIMHVIVTLVLTLLAACSQPSRVFNFGPDSYITSAAAFPNAGISYAQRLALSEADDHCAKMGKKMVVTKSYDVIDIYGGGRSSVTFRCLPKGDPNPMGVPGLRQTLDLTFEGGPK